MIKSLFSGLSGIRVNQIALDVIGNNVANINTPSFKSSQASFSNALAQTIRSGTPPTGAQGGLDPMQIGRGSVIGSVKTTFSQGSMETTNNPTDLGISGEGFFVLRHGEEQLFTRDGSFDVDATGTLVDPSTGYTVQGRMANSAGEILSSTPITDIVLPIKSLYPARATGEVSFTGNLDASAEIADKRFTFTALNTTITGGAGLDDSLIAAELSTAFTNSGITLSNPAVTQGVAAGKRWSITDDNGTYYIENYAAAADDNRLSIYTAAPVSLTDAATVVELDATPPTISTALSGAFTTAGITLSSSATIAKDVTAQRWRIIDNNKIYYIENDGANNLNIYENEAETYQTSMLAYDSLGETHNVALTFARDGANSWTWFARATGGGADELSQPGSDVKAGMLIFQADGPIQSGGDVTIEINGPGGSDTLENGAEAITIDLDLSGLVQYAGSYTPVSSFRDGHGSGTLDNVSFDATGTMIGTFTNGATQKMAQVVLADFYNPGGLIRAGGNLYTVSINSGAPVIGVAASGMRSSIVAGALESSNVDLASEFTKMIIAQRGFEANSRMVMISDAILGEVINLKR